MAAIIICKSCYHLRTKSLRNGRNKKEDPKIIFITWKSVWENIDYLFKLYIECRVYFVQCHFCA